MFQRFCDRCKRKIKGIDVIDVSINSNKEDFHKEVCEECASDIMNLIEYECDRHKLDTVVTISKEAN